MFFFVDKSDNTLWYINTSHIIRMDIQPNESVPIKYILKINLVENRWCQFSFNTQEEAKKIAHSIMYMFIERQDKQTK